MDLSRYLARIRYSGSTDPTLKVLRQLHRAHLLAVPFENLSIGWGEPIVLSQAAHYRKIVECGRGGFCFEQNGLFAWALEELGYEVTLLGASVFSRAAPAPGFGADFSHMMLRVDLESPMLVDVGFGDSFLEPLALCANEIQTDSPQRQFRLREQGPQLVLEMREQAEQFVALYRFELTPRCIDDFETMCAYHQHSAESPFTRHRFITQARPLGRVTLRDRLWTQCQPDGTRIERDLRDEAEVADVLEREFGIVAPRQGFQGA